ncbi:hypothetical protein [Budvicia aquatica]|uniref:hypothetical protein n=1 Tax=Budvicia aquatica TaxID=82979 RepID=UPI0021C33F29|nr:hypothetical protein [Budvicia aquatica]
MSGTHLNVACDGPTARRATGRKPGVNCQTLIKSDNPQRKLGVFAFMVCGKIPYSSTHRLDLSPRINAIWLDKGEWELLKKEGISDKLNSIFTDVWQRRIRESLAHNQFDTLYSTEFGQEDYEKVKSIRAWLLQHPHKDKLTAFLLADNPWSALK